MSQIIRFNRSILWLGFAVVFTGACVKGVEVDLSRYSGPKAKDAGYGATDGANSDGGEDANLQPNEPDSAETPPQASVCGDRVVEDKEECDDGNNVSADGCSENCEVEKGFTCPTGGGSCEACGNGEIKGTEACDDGNLRSGDGCNEFCQIETGFNCVVAGRACEECGNGTVGLGEVCDDGNRNSGDGCNESCTFVEPFFACPEPNKPCEKCGDGVINTHEVCDDGNAASGDGCNAFCTAIDDGFVCDAAGKACRPKCGDSLVVGGETCDDGNNKPGDGCDSNCRLEAGWSCPIAGVRCIASACGDGIVAGDEQCEDGNTIANDGCSAACRLEEGYACKTVGQPCARTVCNDGVKEGSEPCDDGNNVIGDGCNPFCEAEPTCGQDGCKSSCGDGMMLATDNEQCDDGNTLNNDGCSSDCKTEAGYRCSAVTAQLPDTLMAPITYRDFISLPIGDAVKHPDFEAYRAYYATPGLVANTLGADGKPVYSGICDDDLQDPTALCPYLRQTTTEADFNQWYRDTSGVNITSVQRLPLNRQADGSYYHPASFLFPLDGAGWVALGREGVHSADIWNTNSNDYVNDGLEHNFGFTSELRYWFEFQGGESLTFNGDDDVWVFINRRLALDLGGLHPRLHGTVTIDSSGVCSWSREVDGGEDTGQVNLGLTPGKIYEIVLFHAERHTVSSNFNLTIKGFIKAKSACTTVCGDGIVTRDELCDDGVDDGSYGGCMPNCLARGPFCGDGHVDSPKEQCDDGVRNGGYGGYNQCAPGCVLGPRCGDGHKDIGHEQCDDNNLVDGDGCSSTCGLERCGNGLVEAGEQCDDGNTAAGDGCSPRCDKEMCGNGWLDPGEECDDGVNDGGYGKCAKGCVFGPRCGDGHKDDNEGCDDGNNVDGDGCSADCGVVIK